MPRKRSAWAPLLAVEVSAEWRAAAPFLAEVVGRALVEYLEPDTRSTYDTATWSYVDFCTSRGPMVGAPHACHGVRATGYST
jgi:hypothetical protein